MSVFVSIASYRDPELPLTIRSAMENADGPLVFGVCEQELPRYRIDTGFITEDLRLHRMHPREARGAGYARSKIQDMFQNEDFYLQIDSHTRFEPHWDTKLIKMLESTENSQNIDRVILSQFPKAYAKGANGVDIPDQDPKYAAIPTRQRVMWTRKQNWSAKRIPFADKTYKQPEESQTLLAGYVFTRGNWVNEIPYDPDICFFGEELTLAIRSWTRGWKIYSPNEMLINHFYQRPRYHKIWDSGNNADKKWGGLEKKSMDRQTKIYNCEMTDVWGPASIEKFKEYEEFIGLNIAETWNTMLEDRGLRAKTWREAEIDIMGFGPSLSIPCIDQEHEKCQVAGCQCACGHKENNAVQ